MRKRKKYKKLFGRKFEINLAGWGIGLQYARSNDYYLRLDYARKLNGEAFTSEENDKNGRLWFLAYKML